jgi:hypothetical protein
MSTIIFTNATQQKRRPQVDKHRNHQMHYVQWYIEHTPHQPLRGLHTHQEQYHLHSQSDQQEQIR